MGGQGVERREILIRLHCLVDAIQSDESSVRNLPKLLWLLLILVFPIVGPAAWLIAGRPQRSLFGGRSQQQRWDDHRRGRDRKPPPRGPDDDPDFLKGL